MSASDQLDKYKNPSHMQEAEPSNGGLKTEQRSADIFPGWGMEHFYSLTYQSRISDYSSEMTLLSCRGSTTDPLEHKHTLLSVLQNKVKTSKSQTTAGLKNNLKDLFPRFANISIK